MKITREQYEKISDCFPRPRGNIKIDNLDALNAMLYILEHGCRRRGLPKSFGNRHSICTRMNRRSRNSVLDRIFRRPQHEQMIRIKTEAVSPDGTVIKVHPDGTGALTKTVRSPSADPAEDGQQNFIWLPRMITVR